MSRIIFIAADGRIVRRVAGTGCHGCCYCLAPSIGHQLTQCSAAKNSGFKDLPCENNSKLHEVFDLTDEERTQLVTQQLTGEDDDNDSR